MQIEFNSFTVYAVEFVFQMILLDVLQQILLYTNV